jgi:hypothetical protein
VWCEGGKKSEKEEKEKKREKKKEALDSIILFLCTFSCRFFKWFKLVEVLWSPGDKFELLNPH